MFAFPSRRTFLVQAIAMASAGSCGAQMTSNLIPAIDTHQHLWDLAQFRLPWIKAGSPLARNYLLADYQGEAKGTGIEKTIYMEVDVEPDQQRAEADFVQKVVSQPASQMVGGVVSGRPASDGFRGYVAGFRGSKAIRGIRQVLHAGSTPAGYCLQESFIRGIRLLGEMDLSFDLCMRPAELADGEKLAATCPDTRFILDHCGNPRVHGPDGKAPDRTAWKKAIDALAGHRNVACKVSGLISSAKPGAWSAEDLAPIVNHVLLAFGPDRVVFGGDWPVCTLGGSLADWVRALREIVANRPIEEQRKLLHDNAIRIYRIG